MPMKLFMMPHTVPNRPTKGEVEPMVASTPVPTLILRPLAATRRSRRKLTRSLMPSFSAMLADRRSSSWASSISTALKLCLAWASSAAWSRLRRPLKSASSPRRRRRAPSSSRPLARPMVQVITEASSRPSITPCTTTSAFWYMPQGDRSWAGLASSAAGLAVAVAGAVAALGAGASLLTLAVAAAGLAAWTGCSAKATGASSRLASSAAMAGRRMGWARETRGCMRAGPVGGKRISGAAKVGAREARPRLLQTILVCKRFVKVFATRPGIDPG
ncbi:hypothetical protein D3C81_1378600 [compost metagenome]